MADRQTYMLARYLVAFLGPSSGCWQFLALTSHFGDAEAVARHWIGGTVFDLLEWWDGR